MEHTAPLKVVAMNEMNFACAERAMTLLYKYTLAKQGYKADISVRGPFPREEADRLRQERLQRLQGFIQKEAMNQ